MPVAWYTLPFMSKNPPLPAKFWKHPAHIIALGFGAGYVPRLPGTAGTCIGVLVYLGLQHVHLYSYLAVVIVCIGLGIRVCDLTARHLGVHDHSAIVWDEITGYLITMFMAPAGWVWVLLGFILFRLFDIWKPWPVSWADRKVRGGVGIMLDDVIAGLYSLAILQLIAYLL